MKWKDLITRSRKSLTTTSDTDFKNKLGGIMKLYVKWGQRSFLFTLICIVWLVWRVGTKPSRVSYPCTQFASWQVVLFFGSASTPFFSILHKCISHIRRKEYMQVGRIAMVTLLVFGAFTLYQDYQEFLHSGVYLRQIYPPDSVVSEKITVYELR